MHVSVNFYLRLYAFVVIVVVAALLLPSSSSSFFLSFFSFFLSFFFSFFLSFFRSFFLSFFLLLLFLLFLLLLVVVIVVAVVVVVGVVVVVLIFVDFGQHWSLRCYLQFLYSSLCVSIKSYLCLFECELSPETIVHHLCALIFSESQDYAIQIKWPGTGEEYPPRESPNL